MNENQSYENHVRIVPGYHYALLGIVALNLIIRVVYTIKHPSWINAWGIVMAVGFILMAWYLRIFPLAVQDRIIRMEERQRLGRLLPDTLRPRLGEFTRSQLVGLRYASDEELPALAERVLNEGIRDKKVIKQMVRQWRADTLRA